MSNHFAEHPSGHLNRDILKTSFSVDRLDDAHVWHPGQEKIPQNWYRRNSNNQYSAPKKLADTALTAPQYPHIIQIGVS